VVQSLCRRYSRLYRTDTTYEDLFIRRRTGGNEPPRVVMFTTALQRTRGAQSLSDGKEAVMISRIEKRRQAILERLNNQGRRLEKQSPAEALELNAQLEKVVDWLKMRLTKK
jgi:hypothetical protein